MFYHVNVSLESTAFYKSVAKCLVRIQVSVIMTNNTVELTIKCGRVLREQVETIGE
jgi:hypothetical protein